MFRNYLLATLRNLRHQKPYALINLLGLGLGIGCCYLCVLYILHDWSFDRFHQDSDRIYRITMHAKYRAIENMGPLAGKDALMTGFPSGLAQVVISQIPEVETTTRIVCASIKWPNWNLKVEKENFRSIDEIRVNEIILVDESFYEMFSFPFISGSFPVRSNGIVLSEDMAAMLSNNATELIGKTLSIQSERYKDEASMQSVEVTGIIESPPSNSNLRFKALLPFHLRTKLLGQKREGWSWWSNGGIYFVRLAPGADIASIEEKLTQIMKKHPHPLYDPDSLRIRLQPISELHYHVYRGTYRGIGLLPGANPLYAYILLGISVLILSVACVNYSLLYAGRFSARVKEFGLRQILGAARNHLGYQLLFECFSFSILACIVGLSFAELMTPTLEGVLQTQFTSFTNPFITTIILFAIASITGFSTSLYPAALISSLSPLSIVRRDAKFGRSGPFLKVLIGIQCGITLSLVFAALVMARQVYFLTTNDLGFNIHNLISVNIEDLRSTGDQAGVLQQSLAASPGVISIAKTRQPIGWSFSTKLRDDGGNTIEDVNFFQADNNFVQTVGLEILYGRGFEEGEQTGQVIINESLQKRMGITNPLGQSLSPVENRSRLFGNAPSGQIVGVVKDFHFRDLHHSVSPTIITITEQGQRRTDRFREMLIRIDAERTAEFLSHLRVAWEALGTEKPLRFSFVEETLKNAYTHETRWSALVAGASLCAILIASMGTLGLVSLSVARKEKEIALRKILGASPSKIAEGIVFNLTVPGLLSAVVALPIAYFFMEHYLSNFPYQIEMGVGTVLSAILMGVLLPIAGGFLHSFRVASRSPINALREE